MRTLLLRVAIPALLMGCGTTADPPAATPDAWHLADAPRDASAADFLRHDLGAGVLFLPEPPDARVPRSDTVAIHAAPDAAAPVKARFVFDQPGPHGWSYQLWSGEAGLSSNVVEFAYEVSGIPFDSVAAGGWTRVVYGRGAPEGPRTGWVEPRAGTVENRLWRDVLPERSLHFLSPEMVAFHAAPDGPTHAFALDDGYELGPQRVDGDWMEVRVTSPSACAAAAGQEVREHTAWIRFVDPDGRPRVWYHARGC
jgi:hypothetical protein